MEEHYIVPKKHISCNELTNVLHQQFKKYSICDFVEEYNGGNNNVTNGMETNMVLNNKGAQHGDYNRFIAVLQEDGHRVLKRS